MPHISGHNRSQRLLLPESLDEYVGPDNPVRFIDAFVDGLDLAAPGFVRVMAKATGRPGYLPRGSPEAVYLRLPEPGAVRAIEECLPRTTFGIGGAVGGTKPAAVMRARTGQGRDRLSSCPHPVWSSIQFAAGCRSDH